MYYQPINIGEAWFDSSKQLHRTAFSLLTIEKVMPEAMKQV